VEAAAWAAYASGEEQARQAWTEAEAAAWSQSTAATQTAFAAYRDIPEGLQAQANAAWDDYQRTLQTAGCPPQGGPAVFLVQARDPRNFGIDCCGGGGSGAAPRILRPGGLGGIAHRTTVQQRAAQLEREGYKIVGGGGKNPEKAVKTPDGKSRFPDITAERPDGSRHYENVGRARRDGTPIKRERDALKDIEAATGVVPHFTPYHPVRIIGPLP
jgi:hypothetical protein